MTDPTPEHLIRESRETTKAIFQDDREYLAIKAQVHQELSLQECEILRRLIYDALTVANMADAPGYESYTKYEYVGDKKPLPFDQWINDKDMVGSLGADLWPKWKTELSKVCSPKSSTVEWYITGCIGGGKTFAALIAQLYRGPYFCSCLKNPQRYFGIADNTEIVFGLFNAIITNAVQVDFNQLVRFVRESNWFRDHCPVQVKAGDHLIHWPSKCMTLRIGSSELHALGANLFSYMIDEVNFMKTPMLKEADEHQAYKIYHNASRRMKSRFQKFGVSPGLACIVSSRLATTSFLEKLMEDNKGDPSTYVTDVSLWDAKGRENYSPVNFHVAVGNKYRKSEILDTIDTCGKVSAFDWKLKRSLSQKPPEGVQVVKIPADFYFDFRRDIQGSLRDIAGIPTFGINSLIYRTESVHECIDLAREHPFLKETHTLSLNDEDASLLGYLDWRKLCRIESGAWVPLCHPGEPRFVHVDLGLTGDCAAIAVGHAYDKFIRVETDRVTGQSMETFYPKIWVDFMLRIKPVQGEQIDLHKITHFILNLKTYGLWLQRVTFDGYASEHAIQTILKANLVPPRNAYIRSVNPDEVVKIESYVISVDKDDKPYRLLRDMLSTNAVSYYRYQPFIDEVLALEHDIEKKKVDHPVKGSKDVSDAVCGMCWGIATAKTPASQPPVKGMVGDDFKPNPDEKLLQDVTSDYKDASRIQALIPPPTPSPPARSVTGRKILTRDNWQSGLDNFGKHRYL